MQHEDAPALAKVQRRDGWVAIIGMGGVGLMALSIAKGTGFGKIAAIGDLLDPPLLDVMDQFSQLP